MPDKPDNAPVFVMTHYIEGDRAVADVKNLKNLAAFVCRVECGKQQNVFDERQEVWP